jgi:DNA-binding NarL/FixJ family response regulator
VKVQEGSRMHEDGVITMVAIDDHAIVREGLQHMLSAYPDIVIVAVAETGQGGIDQVIAHRPMLVLLDLSLPDMHGLDVLRRLRAEVPDSRVLVLTIHDQHGIATQALKAGAHGYVLKDASREELITAIRNVARGGEYFSASVMRPLLDGATGQETSAQLSDRERDVLRLMAEGLSNREIAATLVVSTETVKTHVSSIFRKMHVSDRAQAVSQGLRNGIIT